MLPDLSFRDSSQSIISSSLTPTGNMVYNPALLKNNFLKEIKMIKQINQHKLPIQVNSVEIARLIGNESVSNIVLLGAALQLGYLPTSYYSLVSAIKNSNNLVSQNIDALNLGRLSVADPSLLAQLLNPNPTGSKNSATLFSSTLLSNRFSGISLDLVEKIAFYANDLSDYHSKKYAEKFLNYLEISLNALTLKFPDQDLDIVLSEIIINTYKLMAFKDEFEVSRLTLLSTENSLVKANMNTNSTYSYLWKLPFVKYKNPTDKTKISNSFNQSISLLAKFKFVRFTPLNPFYFNPLRASERKLNKRYQLKLNSLLSSETAVLDEINLLNAQIMKIKGFGDLKADLIAKYLP
jgi:indolepyruvate ferredoxin oxidoreductase